MADPPAAMPAADQISREGASAHDEDRRDAGLAQAARDGDVRAFETLLARHESRVLRLLRLLGVSRQDRDDVAQDVFVRVFRHLGGFRPGASFGAWLYRVTVNAVHDHRSRHRRRIAVESSGGGEAEAADPADRAPGPDDGLDRRAELQRLEAALDRLSQRERAVFVLCCVEELDTRETAKVLGISRITVRRHLSRARERLQREIQLPEKK